MSAPHRWLAARPRMASALLLGLLVGILLPAAADGLDRLLLGWSVGAWYYLIALWVLMARARPDRIRHIARLQDESALAVLTLVSSGAMISLVAIVFELAGVRGYSGDARLAHLALAAATLVSSWLLLPTLFAMHYAHLYYVSAADARPLLFPDRPATPDYWDFAYFSFTIAVAAQTADIAPNNGAARRLVLAQSLLAFVFNTSILAMSINVAASLVG